MLEPVARVAGRVVHGQAAEHLGERQQGVAEKLGIQGGKPRIHRYARFRHVLDLREDLVAGAADRGVKVARSAVGHRENEPPARRVLQHAAQETGDGCGVGVCGSGYREIFGQCGQDLA
ncbi:hypothetical protein GCM10009632_35900 [Mycolicibacterium alvei]|uniref:Uncharacterized protein n=1 Tax=Mycolicibacterium alvei TaxID=67081 RepID=A0A6N4URG1_9MYCO|nr:hypothetical protein MALV_15880 [Mycolicibacterium alvei]